MTTDITFGDRDAFILVCKEPTLCTSSTCGGLVRSAAPMSDSFIGPVPAVFAEIEDLLYANPWDVAVKRAAAGTALVTYTLAPCPGYTYRGTLEGGMLIGTYVAESDIPATIADRLQVPTAGLAPFLARLTVVSVSPVAGA